MLATRSPRELPVDSLATAKAAPVVDQAMGGVLFLLGLSVVINYIDRSNLSIAAPLIKDELGITASQLGTLLSAFFWTYSLMHIVSGWLVDRFDVKWVFALGFLLWSAATAVTGMLHGFAALLAVRVVLGVGEAVSFPSYGKVLCSYFHEERRGFANAVVISGLALGPAVGMLVGGSVVSRFGWRPFFIVVGLAGLLWLVPWFAWMPRRDPASAAAPSPLSGMIEVLLRRDAWGLWICHFAAAYPLYFLLTWLPYYLTRARGLSLNQMARAGALVFLVYAASSAVTGKLADRWIAAGGSVTGVRKAQAVAGATSTGLFLIAAAVAPNHLCIWMLTMVGVGMGIIGTNLYSAAQTLAGPRMVGRWTGLQQCVGNLAGAVAPAVTGLLLDRTHHFYWPFFLAAIVSLGGALSWLFVVGPLKTLEWKTHRV
jgi:ACS family D-galactonate transporter-like MFS transporter